MMPVFIQFVDVLKHVWEQAALDDNGRRRMGFKHR